MRRVKADVSHRVRRRPSLLGVRWFRVLLGVSALVLLGLFVGPSLGRLQPWRSSAGRGPGLPALPQAATPPMVTRAAVEVPAEIPRGNAEGPVSSPGTLPPKASGSAPPKTATASPPAASGPKNLPVAVPPGPTATSGSGYWIQMGVFLDPRNAERLVERLRGEGLTAGMSVLEQGRVTYRVLLGVPEGATEPTPALIEQVMRLGFEVESTPDGTAVTGAVPLRSAVETSQKLRQQGITVRLKQEGGSAAYRVVRVGSYATSGEAEQALSKLQARGFEGVVVRER